MAWEYCEIDYVNLDLDKQLFGNQSLALSGNVHSKKQNNFEKSEI